MLLYCQRNIDAWIIIDLNLSKQRINTNRYNELDKPHGCKTHFAIRTSEADIRHICEYARNPNNNNRTGPSGTEIFGHPMSEIERENIFFRKACQMNVFKKKLADMENLQSVSRERLR